MKIHPSVSILAILGILFAIRISVHASTGITPFEMMYGRAPMRPVDLDMNPPKVDEAIEQTATGSAQSILDAMQEVRELLKEKAVKKINMAQTRQKESFDRRKKSFPSLSVGTMVMLKNTKRINRQGDKLQRKWIGRYEIIEDMGKGRFKLRNLSNGNVLRNVYNADMLALCGAPDRASVIHSPPPACASPMAHSNAHQMPSPTCSTPLALSNADLAPTSACSSPMPPSNAHRAATPACSSPLAPSNAHLAPTSACSSQLPASNAHLPATPPCSSPLPPSNAHQAPTSACSSPLPPSNAHLAATPDYSSPLPPSNAHLAPTSTCSSPLPPSNAHLARTPACSTPTAPLNDHLAPLPLFCPLTSEEQRSLAKNLLGISDNVPPFYKASSVPIPLSVPGALASIVGDGNCFFRCISLILTGSQCFHQKVRSLILHWMLNNEQFLLPFMPGSSSLADYLSKFPIHLNGTWAAEVEILAAASVFSVNIHIFYLDKWVSYAPFKRIGQFGNIYIANIRGNHFEAVLNVKS